MWLDCLREVSQQPDTILLLFVQFHKGVSSGDLKAWCIRRGAIFLFHPSIHKLSAKGQASIGIPYDIG